MTFQEFFTQYNSQTNVGDTPENTGQCVGLVEKYIDLLGLPHVWGNALDLLNNADPAAYIVIPNTPTNAPSEGDIVVLGKPYGGYTDSQGISHYYGHTGIATKNCTDALLELFEQNDPVGSGCHINMYNYTGCVGWLHPRVLSGTQTTEVPPTVEQVQGQLQTQVQATTQCLTQLKQAQDQVTQLQAQLQTESEKSATLNQQLTDLQNKYDQDERAIIALKTEIAAIHTEDTDYLQRASDAEGLAVKRLNLLSAYADKLGIKHTGLTDSDVANKGLIEIDAIDTENQKLYTQNQQLKKLPLLTPQMITDIKKNWLQTNFQRFIALFVKTNG